MNSYQQLENKLTYNFLCLIEHMEMQKEFCEFLLDNKLSLMDNPITEIQPQPFGGLSNPDGMIRLRNQDKKEYDVYLENKTSRAALDESQLRNHLSTSCKEENSFLLVITPRISDRKIIDKIGSSKTIFKTWSEIANRLKDINKNLPTASFIVSQFIEYGKKGGEFEDMENITKKELDQYIEVVRSNIEGKIWHLFERIATEVSLDAYKLRNVEHTIKDTYEDME